LDRRRHVNVSSATAVQYAFNAAYGKNELYRNALPLFRLRVQAGHRLTSRRAANLEGGLRYGFTCEGEGKCTRCHGGDDHFHCAAPCELSDSLYRWTGMFLAD
jgi:hypothetical protein